MTQSAYLRLSILEISETLMFELQFGYIKPKNHRSAKLCYMDTDSFIVRIKTEDVYEEVASDMEKAFDTSNYEINSLLPRGKNKKVIRLMRDESGGKILTEFVGLRAKTYSYLTDDESEDKKLMEQKVV